MRQKLDVEKLHDLYMDIWKERQVLGRNYSEVSGEILPRQPSSLFFDHLLEKNTHPHLIYEKNNIILVTAEEHERKTKGFPDTRHKEMIELAKKRFL